MALLAVAIATLVGPWLQDARPDGVVVVWESDVAAPGEVVVDTPQGPRRFPSPSGTHHEVRVSGLAPGRYGYRVREGDVLAPPAELTTAATGPSFTFLVYGDNRDHDTEHARVIAAMVAEHADLVLQTGDMTGDGGQDALWRRFFAIEAPLLSAVPMYPALGNHELAHDPEASHYRRYFALPGVDDLEAAERYYSFRYGNALFIALDGNQSHDPAQAAWLKKTLDASRGDPAVRHRFVFFHQPPFAAGDECGSAAEQGLWVPEFERGDVRAVFSGHDHAYERLERNRVRYFVSGGGGAPLHRESAHCAAFDRHALKLFRSLYHFLRVRVTGDDVVLDAIASDGQPIESVRLHEPAPADTTPAPPVPFRVAGLAGSPARRALRPLVAALLASVLALVLVARRRRRI